MKKYFLAAFIFYLLSVPAVSAKAESALLETVKTGNVAEIASVLEKTQNVNIRDKNGLNALMMAAAYNNDANVITLLADSGVRVKARDKEGLNALMLAAAYTKNTDVIDALLRAGSEIDCKKGGNNATALMIALAENKNPRISGILIEAGSDVNAADKDGNTVLFFAAAKGNLAVMKHLLSKAPDLNVRNKNGMTALMTAARHTKNPNIVTALVLAGADADIKTKDGKKALDFARENPALKDKEAFWKLNDATHN